jgi:hypothetical protein
VKLTPENKAHIDGLSHRELLRRWRFAPFGDPWFQGETGTYWGRRLAELQDADPAAHTAASKSVGW